MTGTRVFSTAFLGERIRREKEVKKKSDVRERSEYACVCTREGWTTAWFCQLARFFTAAVLLAGGCPAPLSLICLLNAWNSTEQGSRVISCCQALLLQVFRWKDVAVEFLGQSHQVTQMLAMSQRTSSASFLVQELPLIHLQ